jgi:hypothetical protein
MMDNYNCPEKILRNSDDDDDDMLVPPTRTYFFSIPLTVSLQGQPSAICKKNKNKNKNTQKKTKTMHWRAFSPPPNPK